MSANLDLISPVYMGSDIFGLSVDNPDSTPILAGDTITLNFDYSATGTTRPQLPLILQIQPTFGSGVGYQEVVFRDRLPNSYAFQVPGAGRYLVVLRECFHNRWQGRTLIDVSGEEFSLIRSSR